MKRFILYFLWLFMWIHVEAQTIQVTDSIIQPGCYNAADGAILLDISGTNPPFTILWSNGVSTRKMYGLESGTYSVTISDLAGNQLVENYVLINPIAPVISFTISPVSLLGGQDGAIQAVLLSPDAGNSYAWSNGSTVLNQSSLSAGRYALQITDSLGCTYDTSVYINSPIPAEFQVYKTNDSTIYSFADTVQIGLDGIIPPYGSLIGLFLDSLGTSVCRGFTHYQPGMKEIICYGGEGLANFEHLDVLVYNPNLQTSISCRAGWQGYYYELMYAVPNKNPIKVIIGFEDYFQVAQFSTGWDTFGLSLLPDNDSVAAHFGTMTELILLKDETGKAFWPQYNIHTLEKLELQKGYILKLSAATSIQIPGSYIFPENMPLFVRKGENLFANYSNFTIPINEMSIAFPNTTPLSFIQAGTGHIYWPIYMLNTITMYSGKAFKISMTSDYVYYLPPAKY
ncbi:MAG: hypothetical protein K9I34_03315 [Bacteroidales bacterium]|nr:hypothetical protein [Bacteroidales bacterium]